MLIALGLVAMVVVVGVVVAATVFARRQAESDAPPPSRGGDFVAPVSSGQYRFRAPDESPEDFKARVERENEEIASSSKRGARLAEPK